MKLTEPVEIGGLADWWKDQRNELPLLSRVARHVLLVPASSASSERVFSTAGSNVG